LSDDDAVATSSRAQQSHQAWWWGTQLQPARPLSTVAFVEGKPQRSHRRIVALSGRMLVLRCFAVDCVGEQILGRSRQWSNVGDVW